MRADARSAAFRSTCALLVAFTPCFAAAQDLLQVYRDAKAYDAQYASARQSYLAAQERLPQGRALLLPSLNLAANVTRTKLDSESKDPAIVPSFERDVRSQGYTFSLTQPLYRPQNTLQYEQADWQVRQAEAAFAQAGQDLVLRVTQGYFDLLAAQDSLALVRAQKAAISEQLAQARRNFEVGTATITDTHEAQSRYDLVSAQEIVAESELENRQRALQQITGKEYRALKPLRGDLQLAPPKPAEMQAWVQLAEKLSYAVVQQEAASEIAAREAKRASAGHYPTLDLVATRGTTSSTGSANTGVGSDLTTSTIGLQLAVPLYQGGSVSSRERETAAALEKARQDLELAKRTAALAAQQAYLASISGIAQVRALEQALRSSQSALESNKLGYQVGVRINIDVLNAQQQVFSTQRDLALARYNTLTQQLRLRAAAGSLAEQDLDEVNRALAP